MRIRNFNRLGASAQKCLIAAEKATGQTIIKNEKAPGKKKSIEVEEEIDYEKEFEKKFDEAADKKKK